MKYLQEDDSFFPTAISLHDLNEKERNDTKFQARFKRSRHNNIPIFKIGQDYYELPKRTVRANANIQFQTNCRDIENLNQVKARMVMTHKEFKLLTSIFWKEKYQPLTNDIIKIKYTGIIDLDKNPCLFHIALLFKSRKRFFILR